MLFKGTQLVYLTLVASIIRRGYAAYLLNVRVHNFKGNDKCPECFDFQRPGCCDNFSNTRFCNGVDRCDNFFFYCLRPIGTVKSVNTGGLSRCGDNDRFGKLSGINTNSEPLNFTQDHLLGLPNPVPLRGPTTRWNGIQLYIEVRDADFGSTTSDEFIDRFAIDVEPIPIGNETDPIVYNGTFGFATMTLSFRVDCLLSFYYPACEANGCQNSGTCTCFPGYTGVDCEEEIDECVEANCPENTICVDGLNSFTCRPLDTISPPVTDDCIGVTCSGRGVCVDGVDSFRCACDSGYTGLLCETPLPTSDEILSPTLHVALCIAAVILVTLVLTIITIIQFVMIKKYRPVKKEEDNPQQEPLAFPNRGSNIIRDATPPPNVEKKSVPASFVIPSDQAVREEVDQPQANAEEDAVDPASEVPLKQNVGYGAAITPATPDSKNRVIRPSLEDPEHASRVPNVNTNAGPQHASRVPNAEDPQNTSRVPNEDLQNAPRAPNMRPRHLFIYNSPPPELEIVQMGSNEPEGDDHKQSSDVEADLHLEDSAASQSRHGDIIVTGDDDSGIPSSDAEASSNENAEYFPADAVPIEDSPDSLNCKKLAAPESRTISEQTDDPKGPEATETPV